MLTQQGHVKVMDFGLAKRVGDLPQAGDATRDLTSPQLTAPGTILGTPDYMSPEQLTGTELDVRSDLYSAGVVLFECVTGRVPFEAETTWALIAKHLEEATPDPRALNPDVPEELARVIVKSMAKERAERYQSAAEMHHALAGIG